MDRSPRSRKVMWVLVGCTVGWLVLLPFAFVGLMASVMTAAAPGAIDHVWTNIFLWTWLTLIPALLLGVLLGWLAYWRRWQRAAVLLGLAPLLWVGAIVILFVTWPSF